MKLSDLKTMQKQLAKLSGKCNKTADRNMVDESYSEYSEKQLCALDEFADDMSLAGDEFEYAAEAIKAGLEVLASARRRYDHCKKLGIIKSPPKYKVFVTFRGRL